MEQKVVVSIFSDAYTVISDVFLWAHRRRQCPSWPDKIQLLNILGDEFNFREDTSVKESAISCRLLHDILTRHGCELPLGLTHKLFYHYYRLPFVRLFIADESENGDRPPGGGLYAYRSTAHR